MFELQQIVEPLLRWYDGSHRILPWRESPTPYHVWISEIMLQQTRVEAVKPYYDRFLRALPDIASLAAVDDEELLKLWEGLGYYNRARNLKKAAIRIQTEYGGQMPGEYEELMKLSGIGSYTAGAISSIAFDRPAPAVDGNVLRVIARVSADDGDIMNQKVRRFVEERLLSIMPKDRPGDFNQALMELGAVVCIPNGAPHCEVCPWQSFCQAKISGRISEYPRKSGKKPRVIEDKTVLLIRDENRTAIRKRPEKGLLAGMYEFPMLEGHKEEKEVLEYVKGLGYGVIYIKGLEPSKHIFTHREWHMTGYLIRVDELERPELSGQEGMIFAERDQAQERYPMPAAFARYTSYLKIRLGNDRFLKE